MFTQPIVIAGFVALFTFAAAALGMALRVRLPDHHLQADSKDVVKLVMGLIATLVALVLGLLIASANSFYDQQRDELQTLSANIVNLDQLLSRYGPETAGVRAALRTAVVVGHNRVWPEDGIAITDALPQNETNIAAFRDGLLKLKPANVGQDHLLSQAIGIAEHLTAVRLLIFAQIGNSISWPFLVILVFWTSVLFLGFGLLTESNATVTTTLVVGSVAIASATFLILELNQPYSGLMHLSDAPLRQAIAAIGR